MTQTVCLKVAMSCSGCAGAVKRVLDKMEGVESFDIDIDQQKVTVIGDLQPELVLQTVSKSGKKTAFWEEAAAPPAEPETKPAEVNELKPTEVKQSEVTTEVKPTETTVVKPAEATGIKPAEATTEVKPAEATATA